MALHEKSELIVKAYATALYNAGKKLGVVERLVEECGTIAKIIDKHSAFQRFLESPQISTEKKHDLVNQAFQNKVNPLLLNVLYMMIDRDRAFFLDKILEEFQQTAQRAEGIYPAIIDSSRELDFQEKLRLKGALEAFTGYRLKVRHRVQPQLLGGIVFRFRDQLIDGSVRNELTKLRKRLMGVVRVDA